MKVFNTLTRRKEEFQPIEPGKVRMYSCGPTVSMYATIGNFRSFIFADVLRRSLENKGLEVTLIMNITDVGHVTEDAESGEDKLRKSAGEQQKDPWQIAEFSARAFFVAINTLGLRRASRYPKATEHIQQMIEINRLEAGPQDAAKSPACLDRGNGVLNVLPKEEAAPHSEVDALIAGHEQARKARNFKRSDETRDQLKQKGIALDDTPEGIPWKRVECLTDESGASTVTILCRKQLSC